MIDFKKIPSWIWVILVVLILMNVGNIGTQAITKSTFCGDLYNEINTHESSDKKCTLKKTTANQIIYKTGIQDAYLNSDAYLNCEMRCITCGEDSDPLGLCDDGVCIPKTCNDLDKDCGTWSDGCGTTITCGSCTSPKVCDKGKCIASTSTCDKTYILWQVCDTGKCEGCYSANKQNCDINCIETPPYFAIVSGGSPTPCDMNSLSYTQTTIWDNYWECSAYIPGCQPDGKKVSCADIDGCSAFKECTDGEWSTCKKYDSTCPSHLECKNNVCTKVSGAGTNTCSVVGSSCDIFKCSDLNAIQCIDDIRCEYDIYSLTCIPITGVITPTTPTTPTDDYCRKYNTWILGDAVALNEDGCLGDDKCQITKAPTLGIARRCKTLTCPAFIKQASFGQTFLGSQCTTGWVFALVIAAIFLPLLMDIFRKK